MSFDFPVATTGGSLYRAAAMGPSAVESVEHTRTATIHPSYLHTNTTSHTWVLGAFAELLDNAKDSCAGVTGDSAQRADVNYDAIGDHMVISVVDTGTGMSADKVHLMLSFGHCSKDATQIGQYGNGAKSGALRISRDVLVVTWDGNQVTAALLSQTMHRELAIPIVRIPLASWRVERSGAVKMELMEAEGPPGMVAGPTNGKTQGGREGGGGGGPGGVVKDGSAGEGETRNAGSGVAAAGGALVVAGASTGSRYIQGVGQAGSVRRGNGPIVAPGMAASVRNEILARMGDDDGGCVREEMLVPVTESYQENLNCIMQYSPFEREEHLKDYVLDALVRGRWKDSGHGTAVLMYDVNRPCSSYEHAFPDLDFAADPEDIQVRSGVSLSQTHSQREPPLPLDHSLRRYCELLYLRSDMAIYIRGILVDQMNLVADNAAERYLESIHRVCKFRPSGPGSEVTADVTLGLNASRGAVAEDGDGDENSPPEYTVSDIEYGTLLYNRGRLIRAYERIGLHASKVPLGVGIVAVVDEAHLSVVHNKQAYLGDAPYKALMDRVATAIETYVVEVNEERLLAYGATKLQQEAARKAEELYQRTQQLKRMEESTGRGNLVQCADCLKWRYYPASMQFAEDEDFVCSMNKWDRFNNCDEPMEYPEEDPEAAAQWRRLFVSNKGWPEVRRKIEAWRGGAGMAQAGASAGDDANNNGRGNRNQEGNLSGGAWGNRDGDGDSAQEEFVEFRLGEVASPDGKHRFGLPYGYWRNAMADAVSTLGKGDPVWVAAAATLPRPPSAMSSTTGPWAALVSLARRWEAAHPRTGAGQLAEEIKRAIRASAWIEDASSTRRDRATGRQRMGGGGGNSSASHRRQLSASPAGVRSPSRGRNKKRSVSGHGQGGRRGSPASLSPDDSSSSPEPSARETSTRRSGGSGGGAKAKKKPTKKPPAKITLAALAARRAVAALRREKEDLERQRKAIAADARRRAERERRARELDIKRGRAVATPATSQAGAAGRGAAANNGGAGWQVAGVSEAAASQQSCPGPRRGLPQGGEGNGDVDNDMDDDGFSAPAPRPPRRNGLGGCTVGNGHEGDGHARIDGDGAGVAALGARGQVASRRVNNHASGSGRADAGGDEERLCICRRLASECENDAMFECSECGLALHAECIAFKISELDRRAVLRCEDHVEPGISARKRQRALELATPTCSEVGPWDLPGARGGVGASWRLANGYNCYDGGGNGDDDDLNGDSDDEAGGQGEAMGPPRRRNKPPSWPRGLQGVGYTPCNRYGGGGEGEELRRRLTLIRPLDGIEIRQLSEDHPVYIDKLKVDARPRVFGVFASKRFERPGLWVGDYVGVVTTGRSRANEYVFEVHADQTGAGEEFGPVQVDASRYGNELRFMNDYRGVSAGRRPNVKFEVKHDEVTGELRVRVVTLREVRKGDEFLVDYGDMFPLQQSP